GIALGVLSILRRLVGVRSTFAGFVLSVATPRALNVGLAYYNDHRARNPRPQRPARGGGDIRFREDDRRDDPRGVGVRQRAEPRRRGQIGRASCREGVEMSMRSVKWNYKL